VLLLLCAGPPARAEDFNTLLMKATVKLAHDKSTATAFLLARPDPDNPGQGPSVLVTASHVLEAMTGDEATLFFRRREAEGVYKKVPQKLAIRKGGKPLWTKHPGADVAALYVTPPGDAEVPKLPVDLLATDEALRKYEVHPGDRPACLGYPHRVEANDAGFAVLRGGAIASFPLTPARTNRTFLVSMDTFEGDSGGPVYLAEPGRVYGGRGKGEEVRLILGLVTGQMFLDEEAKLIYGTTRVRHRLGLAVVVPAIFIRETIDRLPPAPGG
jgi:hypothetical protein